MIGVCGALVARLKKWGETCIMVSDIFPMPSNRKKKQSNMKNVLVKNTFLKTSDVNTTTALSTYSTPHPLSTSQKNEIYYFDSLNYCTQHWATVWFVNYCCQWLLNWYVVTELLDVACSFVSFFFFHIFPGHVPRMKCHYVCSLNSWRGYWTICLH